MSTVEDLQRDMGWFPYFRHFGGAYLGLLIESWGEGKYGTFISYLPVALLVVPVCTVGDGMRMAEKLMENAVLGLDTLGQNMKRPK